MFQHVSTDIFPVAKSEVAQFLGARRPFPKTHRFVRRQYRLGHRTDLCRNRSLQGALKHGWTPGGWIKGIVVRRPKAEKPMMFAR